MNFDVMELKLRQHTRTLILADHKVVLGAAGLEFGDGIERLCAKTCIWMAVRWDAHIHVEAGGLLRLKREDTYVRLQ